MAGAPAMHADVRLLIGLVVAARANDGEAYRELVSTDVRDALTDDPRSFVRAATQLIGVLSDEIGRLRSEDPNAILRSLIQLSLDHEAGGTSER